MSTRASRGRRPRNWLGNNLWEHTDFNDRLQPIEIGLGTSQGGTQKLALTFAYESSPGAEDNNGNVRKQIITPPGLSALTQSYTYDSVNRLSGITEEGKLMPDTNNRLILQLAYFPKSSWVLPLKSRLQSSSDPRLVQNFADSDGGDLWSVRAAALTTTLDIGERIVERINSSLGSLSKEIERDIQEVEECLNSDCAYTVHDTSLLNDLLIEADALLFEFQSAKEKLVLFLAGFFEEILGKQLDRAKLRSDIQSWGISLGWEEDLKKLRNLFIHETTPWLAVEVRNTSPFSGELLLVHHKDSVPLDRLKAIVTGFRAALWASRKHLEDEIDHQELVAALSTTAIS